MNKTKIEWCDYTWNPIVGCSQISEGCKNCYAEAMCKRFGWRWGRAVYHPERLDEPYRVKRPGIVFVASMSDLGHKSVTDKMRWEISSAMERAPQHQYIVLTKRPGDWINTLPERCWVGVSVERQRYLDERVDALNAHCGKRLRVLSLEPLLDMVYVMRVCSACAVDWVIAGPETGSRARHCGDEWINKLADDCAAASVPFFDKRKEGWLRREWPGSYNIPGVGVPGPWAVARGRRRGENDGEGEA